MSMSLQDWVRNGWASQHKSTRQEIQKLLALADRDLASCATAGLATDWRFAIAYNSALQSATVALAAAGYRASHEAHHHRVIQSLAFTIGASRELIRRFDAFRKKRNISSYEMGGTISEKEAAEMAAFAGDLRQKVERWIREKHQEFKL
jgi:hypothetical protein